MLVKVWQVGYTTQKDYVLHTNAKCREMGYVEIPDNTENWQEKVWNLLNWSCWADKRPEGVHSSLDHCNSDIILQLQSDSKYMCAMLCGWKTVDTFEEAVSIVTHNEIWPFKDCYHKSGYTKIGDDGKAYWMDIKDYRAGKKNWTEITW